MKCNIKIIVNIISFVIIICSVQSEEHIFFEDFNYISNEIASKKDSALGSIFGFNDWIERDGIKKRKAWYRWNVGEPAYDIHAGIVPNQDGIRLFFKSGLKRTGNQSHMHSTFRFRHGTYASRVKFPKHFNDDLFDIAFWIYSPMSFTFTKGNEKIQYASEIDFEWNNWFHRKNEENLAIGCNNHNYKQPLQIPLKLSTFINGKKVDYDGFDYKYKNQDVFYNQWYICIFVVDTISSVTKIYMKSDYDSMPEATTFGGLHISNETEIEPFVINNYSPDYDMNVCYSAGISSDEAKHDNNFDVDWFFFSTETTIDLTDIKQKVNELKEQGTARINTCGAEFYYHDEKSKVTDSYFNGPDSVWNGLITEWKIDTEYMRWTSYMTSFKYRYHNKTAGWSNWKDYYSNRFRFNSAFVIDSLELWACFKDQWRDIRDTINKIVVFNESPIDSLVSNRPNFVISPNPALYYIDILPVDSLITKIGNVKIYNLLGSEIYHSEYCPVINISDFVPGIYIVAIMGRSYKFVKY